MLLVVTSLAVTNNLHNALGAQRNVIHLLRLVRIGTIVFKQILHFHPCNHPPISAHQTTIASPVPETPPQTHALIPTKHDLPARLADSEVEEGIVADFAS